MTVQYHDYVLCCTIFWHIVFFILILFPACFKLVGAYDDLNYFEVERAIKMILEKKLSLWLLCNIDLISR